MLSQLKSFLIGEAAALAAYLKANPAVLSWLLTVGATLLARFGFHATATQLAVLVSLLATLLHGYVHASIRRKTP